MIESQNQQILSYLKTGKSLSPMDALDLCGSFRLSARIYDLKQAGWPITCERVDVGDGRRVGYYSLVNNKDHWPTLSD